MEILIVVAIWTVVVKRGVEDILHTARGGTPPRLAAAKARRSTGAAGRYWSALWDDVWTDLHNRHVAKRANPDRPRGAATVFWSNLWRDGWVSAERRRQRRTARPRPGQETVPGEVVPNAEDGEPPMYVKDGRSWGNCDTCGQRMVLLPHQTTCAWCTYQRSGGDSNPDAMRRTVDEANRWTAGPGPSQDGDGDRPQDGDGPEPHVVPDEDGGTDLRFGDDPTDPTGTKQCPECGGTVLVDGEVCPSCRDRQEQRNQHHEDQAVPDHADEAAVDSCPKCGAQMDSMPILANPGSYTGSLIRRCPNCNHRTEEPREMTDEEYNRLNPFDQIRLNTTQEGPTMTATTTEVVGLDSAIRFCEDSARAYRAQIQAIEQTQAALAAGDVTGPAAETFTQAMEQSNQAAASMDAAAAELLRHKQVQEAYLANQGAGTRDFILAGQ
jgi:hypothetical protein